MIVIPPGGLKWRAARHLLRQALCHLVLPAPACWRDWPLSWHERLPTILEQIPCLFFSCSAVCSADVAHNTVAPSHLTETFHCRFKPSRLHSERRMTGFTGRWVTGFLTFLSPCAPVLFILSACASFLFRSVSN